MRLVRPPGGAHVDTVPLLCDAPFQEIPANIGI